ncbi:Ndr domain containing protein [Trichuris trichiura]|uniref:Ndr domain containing protein n=1 Tax=Trichuris trichiura TaxID=36087 RepID=A0A077ZMU0_TRITR|nr:Ndr domain containing protein [Trichuris trichiura]
MEDLELGKLELSPAALLISAAESHKDYEEVKVDTSFGKVCVYVVGDQKKPAILTFHDLGLSANPCFQSFFHFSEMSAISDKFCVYHVNAPGQEEDAEPLAEKYTFSFILTYVYPTMDELGDIVIAIADHFKLKTFIGFGVGAGANVLCRLAVYMQIFLFAKKKSSDQSARFLEREGSVDCRMPFGGLNLTLSAMAGLSSNQLIVFRLCQERAKQFFHASSSRARVEKLLQAIGRTLKTTNVEVGKAFQSGWNVFADVPVRVCLLSSDEEVFFDARQKF